MKYVLLPFDHSPFSNNYLSSLATTKFPNLLRLSNDPILKKPFLVDCSYHDTYRYPKLWWWNWWGPIVNITTYHLWCVSNSLLDDSIFILLFPHTLANNTLKWFINFSTTSFNSFTTLVMSFLTHFKLHIWYEIGTKIMTSLWWNNATHIFDHIHEWGRCRWLVKAMIHYWILVDWFSKSLLPPISKYISMVGDIIEEKNIYRSQQLDLIYSQLGTLYDIIPNAL